MFRINYFFKLVVNFTSTAQVFILCTVVRLLIKRKVRFVKKTNYATPSF